MYLWRYRVASAFVSSIVPTVLSVSSFLLILTIMIFHLQYCENALESIKGDSEEEIVARAKLLLDKGDVASAMKELQSLQGASAEAAMPWMDSAAGNLAVDQSSDYIIQNLMESMSGGSVIEDLVDAVKSNIGGGSGVVYMSPALRK